MPAWHNLMLKGITRPRNATQVYLVKPSHHPKTMLLANLEVEFKQGYTYKTQNLETLHKLHTYVTYNMNTLPMTMSRTFWIKRQHHWDSINKRAIKNGTCINMLLRIMAHWMLQQITAVLGHTVSLTVACCPRSARRSCFSTS